MKWNNAVAAFGLFAPTHALLRFGCSKLTIQRLDPLVTPGQNPSPHLHQIIGGVCHRYSFISFMFEPRRLTSARTHSMSR